MNVQILTDNYLLIHFQTNTFQCILATDGTQSYVLFLYVDGEMQWTTGDASGGTAGLGGAPAQAGFNAGNGVNHYSLPGSRTSNVLSVANSTNAAVPGLLIFKVDSNSISIPTSPSMFIQLANNTFS